MPCTKCGKPGHNAKTCGKSPNTTPCKTIQKRASQQPYTLATDSYESIAKVMHRYEFVEMIKVVQPKYKEVRGIVYLETKKGELTKILVAAGFLPENLFPCNFDKDEVEPLANVYPGINPVVDNIHHVVRRGIWLAVWYDMTGTWLRNDEWDPQQMPTWGHAAVISVTLSARAVKGGTEQFAIELQKLLDENGGDSRIMAQAYCGRGNMCNMVHAAGFFAIDVNLRFQMVRVPIDLFDPFDTFGYKINDNHILGIVTNIESDDHYITYLREDGQYFAEEDDITLSTENVLKYIVSRV